MTTKKNSKKKTSKKFKITWDLKKPMDAATIFINGIFVAYVVASLISGFINLVFIANLTKSPYSIGTLFSMPGAILLGLMSITLDILKVIHAVMINTLSELRNNMIITYKEYAEKIKKQKNKWMIIYILYVGLSILTSMSLAVTSISGAIREQENTIILITEDYNELALLDANQKSDKADKRDVTRSNITGTQTARENAEKEVNTYWGYLEEYRNQRDKIEIDDTLSDEQKEEEIIKIRNKVVQRVPKISSKQADYISQTEFKQLMQNISTSIETDTTNINTLNSLIKESNEEINLIIKGLEGRYTDTDGNPVTFMKEDGEPVTLQEAMATLKTLKSKYENNGNPEIGDSSKLYILLSDAIRNKSEKPMKSGFGTTEIMLMITLLFLSLLIELGINQTSPKVRITRKLLGKFSEYLPEEDGFEDKMMLKVYLKDYRHGYISKEELLNKAKECVDMMKVTEQSLIDLFTDNKEIKKVSNEEVIKEVVKEAANEPGFNSEEINNLVSDIKGMLENDRNGSN